MFAIEVIDDFMNPVYGDASRQQAGGVFTVYAGESMLLLSGKTHLITTGFRICSMDSGSIGFLSPHYDSMSPQLIVAPMVLDKPGKTFMQISLDSTLGSVPNYLFLSFLYTSFVFCAHYLQRKKIVTARVQATVGAPFRPGLQMRPES